MICSPVLMEAGPFAWGPFKDEEVTELIDAGVAPLIAPVVRRTSFSWAADTRASGIVWGVRLRFCMTDADMSGEADEIELVVIIPMYRKRLTLRALPYSDFSDCMPILIHGSRFTGYRDRVASGLRC